MTFEESVILIAAATLAVLALTGALMARRVLGRTGGGLRALDEHLIARAESLPRAAAATRERIVEIRGETERALWSLSNLDAQMESARLALADKRVASDTLRVSMMHNRHMLERIRNGARMLLRVIQMRREFLG